MATLTVYQISRSGVGPTYVAAAAGGDQFANDGKTFVHVKNGGGSAITATFVTQKTVDGEAVADKQISVGNGAERMIGPFPAGIYNDANGNVQVTYSGVTSVTVAALRL